MTVYQVQYHHLFTSLSSDYKECLYEESNDYKNRHTYPENANCNCFQTDQAVIINKRHKLDISIGLSLLP